MNKYEYTLSCKHSNEKYGQTVIDVKTVKTKELDGIWQMLLAHYEQYQLKEELKNCLLAVADGLAVKIDNKKLKVIQGNRLDRIYRLGKAYHELAPVKTAIDLDDGYEKIDSATYYYKPVEDEIYGEEDYEDYKQAREEEKDKDSGDCELQSPIYKVKKAILVRIIYLISTVIIENEDTRPDEMFELIKPAIDANKDITLLREKIN